MPRPILNVESCLRWEARAQKTPFCPALSQWEEPGDPHFRVSSPCLVNEGQRSRATARGRLIVEASEEAEPNGTWWKLLHTWEPLSGRRCHASD